MNQRGISRADEQRLAELAPAAIERLRAHGLGARREVAVSLIIGGSLPLFGFLLLGWTEQSTAVSLTLNLAIGLAGDWLRVVAALGRFGAVSRVAVEDRYVWALATALARGGRAVNPKWTPSLNEVDAPRSATDALLLAPIGFGPGLFAAWMIGIDGTLHVEPAVLTLGTLPFVAIVLFTLSLDLLRARSRGPCTGAVAAQTSPLHASLVMMIGTLTLVQVGMALPDPSLDAETWLVFASACAIAAGLWYLRRLTTLERSAAWLEGWIERRRN
jgi:hypothetical protein